MLKESGKNFYIIGLLCILLLAAGACQGREPELPIATPAPTAGTETVPPTKAPEPTGKPTAEAVPTAEPLRVTKAPAPSDLPAPSRIPEPTKAVKPSKTPTATPTPTVTPMPTAEPTKPPQPTKTPEPTNPPEPTKAPEPTKVPEPNPLTLVGQGWQSMLDITMRYYVVFPDCFTHCAVSRTEDTDSFIYTSEAYPELTLTISYVLGQTYEDAIERIGQLGGLWLEQMTEEKRAAYRVDGTTKTCGRLLENTFESWLLYGSAAGEAETTGILWVELSYPKDQEELFESEQFRFFFCELESRTD